jgi:ribonuclease BN (tRNA processing enzyme)
MTRVTIVGVGTSAPQPSTPASGVLVESAETSILVDCGQGVIRGVMPIHDPRELGAIVIGHMHADHYIDLVSLRYLMPWADFTGRRIPVYVPPGGRQRLDELAAAISERVGFFDHTFDIAEYDPDTTLAIGDLTLGFIAGRHYVPAWGCTIEAASGQRVVVSGDTGPNEDLVAAARGADLLIVEATLLAAGEDDPARGHLTADEAIDQGARAGAGLTVLVHHRPQNRQAIEAACRLRPDAVVGVPGLAIQLDGPDLVVGGESSALTGDGNPQDGLPRDGVPQDGGPPAGIASSASRARCR